MEIQNKNFRFLKTWNPNAKKGFYDDPENRRRQLLLLRHNFCEILDVLAYKTDGGSKDSDENCVKSLFLSNVNNGKRYH